MRYYFQIENTDNVRITDSSDTSKTTRKVIFALFIRDKFVYFYFRIPVKCFYELIHRV